jgi:hypothetical protein
MAHIRSILPQRGGVSPVDNNTAALFHYDDNAGDNIKGLKPIGNQRALAFNGTSTRIQLTSTSMFNTDVATVFGNNISIDMWIWLDTLPNEMTSTYGSIFDSSSDAFVVYLQNNGELRFKVVTSNSTVWVATPQSKLKKGAWFHLACTYDGVNATTYIDGVVTTSLAITGNIIQSTPSIGFDGTSSFKGRLSNLRLWNKGLSSQEVVQAKNNSLENDSKVAHWKLDENSGTIAYDCSKTGNDGLISGTVSWTEGPAIYSLVSGGYPGGTGKGAFLEEGTINIVTNPIDPSTWPVNADTTYGYVSHSVVDTELGKTQRKIVQTQTTTDYRGTLTSIPWATPTDMTKPWTFTIYARVVNSTAPGANINLNYQGADVNGVRQDLSVNGIVLTSDWQRITITKTPATDSTFASIISYMKVYTNPPGGVGNQATIDIVMPQMEQKSYPTTFVNGTRSKANLCYSDSILNEKNGTISFWYKPIFAWSDTTTPNGSQENLNEDLFTWGTPGQTNCLWMRRARDARGIFAWFGNSATSYSTNSLQNNDWVFITYTWTEGSQQLFINGVLAASASGTGLTRPTTGYFEVGSREVGTTYPTAIGTIDELRIDNIVRTSTEIASWYYQGRNGW